jgi:hypothetical protein
MVTVLLVVLVVLLLSGGGFGLTREWRGGPTVWGGSSAVGLVLLVVVLWLVLGGR